MKKTIILMAIVAFAGLAVFIYAQGPERPRFVSPAQVVIDSNSDGTLSAEEISKAPEKLRGLDKNGDGRLTEDELRPNFERERREGGEGPRTNPGEDLANTLMSFDANKDGKLAKTEVPERMQGIFTRADADKDGFLTRDELVKSATAQASAAQSFSGGNRPGGGRDEHDEREGRRPGGPGGPGGGMMRFQPLLSALDTDSDGAISAKEIDAAPVSLKKLDKNGDGRLTEDELRPAFGPGGPGGPEGGRFGGSPEEMLNRIMSFDKNGDGKLSSDELPDRMREMMDRLDTNKDGFLTRDELKQTVERGPGRRPE